jgi:anti-anti-sigma factor
MAHTSGDQPNHAQNFESDVRPLREGKTAQIVVTGEIDLVTGQRLRDTVEQLESDRNVEVVVLDFEGVTFMDSTGLYTVLDAHQRLGPRLRIVLSPPVARLLDITGLGRRLTVIGSTAPVSGWRDEVVTDHELDNAIVAMLGVRRAEYRTGFTMHRGITAGDIASITGQPLERVELRLLDLESVGRVTSPTEASGEWARPPRPGD